MHKAGALLLAHHREHIWAHSQAVAAAIDEIAEEYALDRERCKTAALCHDIGGILPAQEQLRFARENGWRLDPAEERYPFLLHQRIAVTICRDQLDIRDPVILSAIGCHTTLKAHASPVDMALFLADKLAWDQPGDPPYKTTVSRAMQRSLAAGCLAYLDYIIDHEMILMPHQWLLQARNWLRNTITE